MSRIIIGTVRGRSGPLHTVVLADGSKISLVFEGAAAPPMGVDVIGVVDESDDVPRMRLVPDVASAITKGRCFISLSGRSDITARMLGKMLDGAGSAIIKPGVGGVIERTPNVDNPDLARALLALGPAARKLGIALNVIDPIALARSEWSEQTLQEDLLPADAVGETRGLADLRRLMRDGFTPACRRTIQSLGRGRAVSSVDFIMPFSPFTTGFAFSNALGLGDRNEVPRYPIAPGDARLLSSLREMALAFSQRYLGLPKERPGGACHLEEAFADATAAILFVKIGGDAGAVKRMALLREAALARWNGEGECPPATHTTLKTILGKLSIYETVSIDRILSDAASAAQTSAPKSDAELESLISKAVEAVDRSPVFIDLDNCGKGTLKAVRRAYQRDLDDTVSGIADSPRAVERFCNFGLFGTPIGMEDIFDAAIARLGSPSTHLAEQDASVIGGAFDDFAQSLEHIADSPAPQF